MALLKAEVNRLKSLAESMRSASRPSGPLDNLVSDLGPVAKALEANGSLGTLGYGGMVSEVQQHLERELQTLNDYAETLEHVIDLIEHYETDVIETIGGTVDREDEHLVHDAELVDQAIWATDGSLAGAAAVAEATESSDKSTWDVVKDFLTGKVEKGGALAGVSATATGEVLGMDASGAVTGSFMSGSVSLKPEGKWNLEDGEANVAVVAKAEGSVASVKAEGDLGYAHGSAQVNVLTGSAEGKLQAGFLKGGKFDPSLEASAKAEVAVASGSADVRVGSESYNIHGEAKGQVLSAKAEAGAKISKEGVEVSAGAEAFLASGEVKGGFTVLGVQVNATAAGHAGGAGISASGGINHEKKVVKFKVGAGVLVGAGAGLEVDYSGFGQGVEDTVNAVKEWWDGTDDEHDGVSGHAR